MKTFYSTGKKLLEEITEYYKGAVSYSFANKLLRKKDVKLNGVRVKTDQKTCVGDKIEVYYDGEDKRADEVLFLDENVVVLYKPQGITSEDFFSLVKKKFSGAGFIHRLDRNTDGIMIFSLNEKAEEELLKGFKERSFEKYYLAEVYGEPKRNSERLESYLFKDAEKSEVIISDTPKKGYEKIITEYKVIKSNCGTTLLEVKLVTGKTHQIRAHLAHVGHFIIGDGKYGSEEINRKYHCKRQRLTAYKLVLKFSENSYLRYLDGKTFEVGKEF